MFGSRYFARFATSFCLVIVLSSAIFADTVRLKDGSIIKGTITGFTGGKFTVEIGEGSRKRQLTFDATEVESIEFEPVARTAVAARQDERPVQNTRYEPAPPQPVQTRRVEQPRVEPRVSQPVPTQTATSPRTATAPVQPSAIGAKPVELSIKVLADNTSNGWTNSGWIVKKGQRIRITGTGEVLLGAGKKSEPAGLWDLEDGGKLLKAVPTGALIAVIGDDNNDFIYVGDEREFVATRDGALFLGVNEGNLNDNSGAYAVKIEIFPG
jgi:hypothetical protein